MSLNLKQLKFRALRSNRLDNEQGISKFGNSGLLELANEAALLTRIDLKEKTELWAGVFKANKFRHKLPSEYIGHRELFVCPTDTFKGFIMQEVPYSRLQQIERNIRLSNNFSNLSRQTVISLSQITRSRSYLYAIDERFIHIDPLFSEDVAFHMWIVKHPIKMVSDSDVPDMSPTYHNLILSKLRQLIAEDLPDGKPETFESSYNRKLRSLRPTATAQGRQTTVAKSSF